MKKTISLLLLTLSLTFVSSSLFAQDKYGSIDENAKRFSTKIQKLCNLDDNQTALIWRAYYVKKKNEMEQLSSSSVSKDQKEDLQAQFDGEFKKKMINILSAEQFEQNKYWLQKSDKE